MSPPTAPQRIGDLFDRDPTRIIEEVVKVDGPARAEDVHEFVETQSAKIVVRKLSEVITTDPNDKARFLYVHATFGSGKTHLLKLIGYATGQVPGAEGLDQELADRLGSFDELRDAFQTSHTTRFIPVLLNLLDRDATKEPPLPLLLYRAVGRRIGLPTEPAWLLEWAVQHAEDLWPGTLNADFDGMPLKEVLQDKDAFQARRPLLRNWLGETVPGLPAAAARGLDSKDTVLRSIEDASDAIAIEAFDAGALVKRLTAITRRLSADAGGQVEVLFGLDEVALFIGNDHGRFRELQETVEALVHGPNPPFIGTGQWSLSELREDIEGDPNLPPHLRGTVPLHGADTEVIVRKRWLRKSPPGKATVTALVEDAMLPPLVVDEGVELAGGDAVESYPLRSYDLWLLRRVMQGLVSGGRPTERDHIQGRALLVLVRGLFTRDGWADREPGALVPWDTLHDLLVDETALIPGWVQDLLQRFDATLGSGAPRVTSVAKVVYLLNHAAGVPATRDNIVTLLVDHIDADRATIGREVDDTLELLRGKHFLHEEEDAQGRTSYKLLSEHEVRVAEKIETRTVGDPRVRSQLLHWIQSEPLLSTPDNRIETDIGSERKVPLRALYSILTGISMPPREPDAITLRVLGIRPDGSDHLVDQWVNANDDEEGPEDLLVRITLQEGFLEKLRRVLATEDVLNQETQRHPELEAALREDKRALEREFRDLLHDAPLVRPDEGAVGTYGASLKDTIVDLILPKKFPDRKVLRRPLQAIDDARALASFFLNGGAWPLDDADAELLGVDVEQGLLADGWCQELLAWLKERHPYVNGSQLLDLIEGATAPHAGSPVESLGAALLVLATAREVELKRDGRSLLDPAEMGRAVRTKAELRQLGIRPEPPIDTRDLGRLRTIHEHLTGTAAENEDADGILANVSAWAQEHRAEILDLQARATDEFHPDAGFDALVRALDPALRRGEDLERDAFQDPSTVAGAERFAAARDLLGDANAATWQRYEQARAFHEAHYPGTSATLQLRQLGRGGSLPNPERFEELLDNAGGTRCDRLRDVGEDLLGEPPSGESPDAIVASLQHGLAERADDVRNVAEQAQDLPGGFDADALGELLGQAQAGTLDEASLVAAPATELARTLSRARSLFAPPEPGEPALWQQFSEAAETYLANEPEADTAKQVRAILDATSLPRPASVRAALAGITGAPRPTGKVDALMAELDRLEDGAVVLINPKGASQ